MASTSLKLRTQLRCSCQPVSACLTYSLFRFEPLFYHKSFDRFVPWEQREKTMAPRRQIGICQRKFERCRTPHLVSNSASRTGRTGRTSESFRNLRSSVAQWAAVPTTSLPKRPSLNTFHVAALRGVVTLRCGSQAARQVKLLAL